MKPNKKYYPLVLALLLGLCWWITPAAFSEDNHMDHGSMDHGSMDHGEMDHSSMGHSNQPASSGDEYRTDPGQDMGHGHMDHGKSDGSIFRTMGAHDDLGMSKPENLSKKALMARGRNIYLHMCVFCHGKDGNGGGNATEYLSVSYTHLTLPTSDLV